MKIKKSRKIISAFLAAMISVSAMTTFNASAVLNGKWSGDKFYFTDGTRAMGLTELQYENGITRLYRFTEDGYSIFSGFAKDDDLGEKYYYSDGIRAVGWRKINNSWYHYDMNGVASTGKAKINGKYYTFNEKGKWLGKMSASEKYPSDFKFSIKFGMNINNAANGFDTEKGIITKDLILDGKTSAEFSPSKTDLQVIYSSIKEYGLIEMSELGYDITSDALALANDEEEACGVEPNGKYIIEFTLNGETYKVCGDDSAKYHPLPNETADRFNSFVGFITSYYVQTDAYKALPAAEGGYD